MRSPLLVLHIAIGDRIVARTSFDKVYDDTPENEIFPYLTMGNLSASNWSDKSTPGQEVDIDIHIWSRYGGKKEVLELNDAVIQALSDGDLDLGSGFNAVLGDFDRNQIIMDLDGFTKHSIITFRYLIEER